MGAGLLGFRSARIALNMNLNNEEAQRLAQELAALTGETVTLAVTEAIRERLDRLRQTNRGTLAERLLAIGKDCAPRLKEPFRSVAHGDLLYGERGLSN